MRKLKELFWGILILLFFLLTPSEYRKLNSRSTLLTRKRAQERLNCHSANPVVEPEDDRRKRALYANSQVGCLMSRCMLVGKRGEEPPLVLVENVGSCSVIPQKVCA